MVIETQSGTIVIKTGKGQMSPLYSAWHHIKTRCYDDAHERYKNYGGRGISMCDEWKNNPRAFILWALENGYRDGLTIERIDTNGNYCPENCRWATQKEQQNNRTNNRTITYKGKTQTIAQWAEETGIKYTTLWQRIYRYNWSIEKAMATP